MAEAAAVVRETATASLSPEGVAHIDGRIVAIGEARIPILDWGFLRADATYDAMHVWQGRFFRLDDHLDRFARNVGKLRMRLPLDRAAIRQVMLDMVRATGLREAVVWAIATRGVPPPGKRDPRYCENRFYGFAIPFTWIATFEKQEQGLHMAISSVQRIPPEAVDPTVKNFHWLDLINGLFEAFDRGAEIAVLCDAAGNLTEGPGFNIFVVKGGRIATPDRGGLEGITRRSAIEFARDLQIPVEIRPVPAGELLQADEAFISSTAGGIIPITKVDGRLVAGGKPGPLTWRVRELYWARHQEPQFATPAYEDA